MSMRPARRRAGPPNVSPLSRGSSGYEGSMSADVPKPDYAHNMRIIAHSDQGGRPDGVQIMVHRGFAYIGHMFSKGFSVIDVRDAKRPRAVNYLPASPGTWNIHLQTHDDLLLVINAKDMFAAAEFADEKAYYRGQLGKTVVIGRPGSRSMTYPNRTCRSASASWRSRAAGSIVSGIPVDLGPMFLLCSTGLPTTSS